MTVSTVQRRFTYSADGTTKDFPIEFEFLNDSEIKAFHIDSLNVETEVLDIHVWKVTPDNPNISLVVGDAYVTVPSSGTAYPIGDSVRIERIRPYTQLDDYTQQGKFSPEDMERTADGLTMIAQQIRDTANDVEDLVGIGLEGWRDDAVASANAAAASEAAAAQSESTTFGYIVRAESARDRAELAEAGAQAAQGLSEAARDLTLPAVDRAETARDESEAARDRAELAKIGVVAARDRAEAAMNRAEPAAVDAEAALAGVHSLINVEQAIEVNFEYDDDGNIQPLLATDLGQLEIPAATAIRIGGIMVGEGLLMTGGVLSAEVLDTDIRLSDDRTPKSHVHGNISNTGAIGTITDLIVKTTTGGQLTAMPAGTAGQYLKFDGSWDTPPSAIKDWEVDTNGDLMPI